MSKRILVIDDEEHICTFFTRLLGREGYTVITAGNGQEALNILEHQAVNLIILDMNMPLMNGLEFLHKNRDEEYSKVPVLMMSGSQNMDHRIESYQLGVYDFIRKPEETEVLLKRIENGLKIGEMKDFNDFIKIELLMAQKLQKYLFPESKLVSGPVEAINWCRPLSDIGGDLYDYVLLRNGKVLFLLADVSGHSISGAIFTAIVKMIFRNALKESLIPCEILAYMNSELAENLPAESFVTAFCCLLDPEAGKLIYANAGHPQPMRIRGGKVLKLPHNDPFLGPIKSAEFINNEINLEPGDQIFLFTDGVMDVLDFKDNRIGQDDLMEILVNQTLSLEERSDAVIELLSDDEIIKVDDCTFMMVRYSGE